MLLKKLNPIFANNIRTFTFIMNRNSFINYYADLLVKPKINLFEQKRFTEKTAPESQVRTLVRQEPGAVRLGLIPDEWFTFFFPKTGVSGFGTFTFTFGTFLISKEYYVMEHEYYGGLSMIILCTVVTKYAGPVIAQYLDKEIDAYEKAWADQSNNSKTVLEKNIKHEKYCQWSSEGQLMLIEAKRENIGLQLEAAYRERLMRAYAQTKKQLQYCVERSEVEKALIRRHMTSWVIKEVSKALSDKIEKESLNKCMDDLQKLSKGFKDLSADYPPPDESNS